VGLSSLDFCFGVSPACDDVWPNERQPDEVCSSLGAVLHFNPSD
jgi:hypothetical protein